MQPLERSVVLVTDVPLRLDYPNGFSGRLHHFVSALAARRTVDVVALIGTATQGICGPTSTAAFVDPALGVRDVVGIEVPPDPWRASARTPRIARLWRRTAGSRLPLAAHPASLPALRSLVDRTRPAVVVVHHAQFAQLVAEVPARTPVLFAFEEGAGLFSHWTASLVTTGIRRRLVVASERRREARLYRRAASRAAVCTAISEEEARRFTEWVPGASPVVVRHGVDCALYAPRTVERYDFDIAVVGVMHVEPRYRDALAVFHASRASTAPDVRAWRWAFAGVGTENIAPLVGASAVCAGPVNDVRDIYARSRVVVVPSRHGVGVKTTVMQAWAMGRPVVASPQAVRQLEVDPGVNVLVGDSPAEIVEHIRSLLVDPARAAQLGAAGRATVERHRDVRQIAEQFADLCEEVAATGQRPSASAPSEGR